MAKQHLPRLRQNPRSDLLVAALAVAGLASSRTLAHAQNSPPPRSLGANATATVGNAKPGKTTTGKTTTSNVKSSDVGYFANSRSGLNAKLTANYAGFSFNYPPRWTLDRQGTKPDSINFVKVSHDEGDFTYENFAVGYFKGTRPMAAALMQKLEPSFAKAFPHYKQVSHGPVKFNDVYSAYQLAFTAYTQEKTANPAVKGKTLQLYGKVFLIPSPKAGQNGVSIIILGTSKSPALHGIADLGVKGELPMVINSFRLKN